MELDLKPINDLLKERFFVPHYQRGYRWTSHQVEDLLNDIDSFTPRLIDNSNDKTWYCLQPIVLKECNQEIMANHHLENKWWEVIDGQQRLTTIFLIIHYANEMWIGKQKINEFSLQYETRKGSTDFLESLKVDDDTETVAINKEYIDYYHISNAYKTIHEWVNNYSQRNLRDFDYNDFLSKFRSNSKVIWYTVDQTANSIELFTRLNMGKIPLTNAELIKALFLSASSFNEFSEEDAVAKKIEISQLWDQMELEFNNSGFWAFSTNRSWELYSTKIELLFDLISLKPDNTNEALFTFLHFQKEMKKGKKLWDLWLHIEQYYLTLQQWYKDKNLYHKVGYLIATGNDTRELIEDSFNKNKDAFELSLNKKIAKTIDFDFEKLSYSNSNDYDKLEKVLLLFNAESIRMNNNITEFYPFNFHKWTNWSIEHIHAQNSEFLDKTKRDQWLSWLDYHEQLISEIYTYSKDDQLQQFLTDIKDVRIKINWDNFDLLATRIFKFFTEFNIQSNGMHSLSNLALLSHADNAALNNSVFEVKRREIIKLDKQGSYIPLCTKRAFLKYYSDTQLPKQYYFWSQDDQRAYYDEIIKTLQPYIITQN